MGPLMRTSAIVFCECPEGPAPESIAPGLGAIELEHPPDSFCPFRVDFAELERSFFFCLPSSVEDVSEVTCSVFLWDSTGRGLAVELEGPAGLGDSIVDGLGPGSDWSADRGVCAVDRGPGVGCDSPSDVAGPVTGREAGFRVPALARLADLVVGGRRGPAVSCFISACSIPGVSVVGGRSSSDLSVTSSFGLLTLFLVTTSSAVARKAESILRDSSCTSGTTPDSRVMLCISDRHGDATRPDAAST